MNSKYEENIAGPEGEGGVEQSNRGGILRGHSQSLQGSAQGQQLREKRDGATRHQRLQSQIN